MKLFTVITVLLLASVLHVVAGRRRCRPCAEIQQLNAKLDQVNAKLDQLLASGNESSSGEFIHSLL